MPERNYDGLVWDKSRRTWSRIGGACVVSITAYAESMEILANTDSFTELPNLTGFVWLTGFSIPIVYLFCDGAIDIIKGTHHFLTMKTLQKIQKNPQKKASLQSYIDYMTRKNVNDNPPAKFDDQSQ